MDWKARYDEVRQLRASADDIEADLVRQALDAHDGNVSRAADALGVGRSYLDGLLHRGRLRHLAPAASKKPGRPTPQKMPQT